MPNPLQITAATVDLRPRVSVTTTVVGSPALAAETIVAQTVAFGDIAYLAGVILVGLAAFTVGTTGSAVTVRLRQTGLAGTVVYTSGALTGGIAAANLVELPAVGFDTAPAAGQVYVLTLQVTAATAASTVTAVALAAIAV